MTSIHRRDFVRAASSLALLGLTECSSGDSHRPLRIIVPLSVGATGDIVARKLLDSLSKTLGRPVYVDNIPGAGGIIGTQQLVQAPKDGNTILIVSSNHATDPGIYAKMPYDAVKDVTALAVIGDSPQVLLVNPSVPANNLQELIALAKAKPGQLHYGSGGVGTTIHLMGVELAKQAGIDIVHVPYKGNSPMLTDLLGGQVQMAFNSTTLTAPYVKAGKLKAIGIASKGGSRLLPDVPTMAAQGLPDFDLSIWMIVLGPAGLPPATVDRLNKAVNQALQSPDNQTWFHNQDWRVMDMTPAEATTFLKSEVVKYTELAKESGARQQS